MGHGITEVVAIAGYDVMMRDVEREFVEDGYASIEWSLKKLAEKGSSRSPLRRCSPVNSSRSSSDRARVRYRGQIVRNHYT